MTLHEAIEEVKKYGGIDVDDMDDLDYYEKAIATILNAVVKGELK